MDRGFGWGVLANRIGTEALTKYYVKAKVIAENASLNVLRIRISTRFVTF